MPSRRISQEKLCDQVTKKNIANLDQFRPRVEYAVKLFFVNRQLRFLCLGDQSRHPVDRNDDGSIWLKCPDFVDVFVRCQPVECLEAACIIVGVKEVAELARELIVIVIVIPFHGCLLDCAIYPLDLSVHPWMVWLN